MPARIDFTPRDSRRSVRTKRSDGFVISIAAMVLLLAAMPALAAEPAAPDFARDIEPVLAKHCYACHGPEKQELALRFDRRASALAGGDGASGPAVVPGKPDESVLLWVLEGTRDDVSAMPPEGEKLTVDQVALFRRWVEAGAPWPDDGTPAEQPRATDHWAFKPPVQAALPPVGQADWCREPLDRFVLATLEANQMQPSPEADRTTLLRRLCLDLVGLPPTPEEVDAFAADSSADAWDRQIERLLASPHYGEVWARHWLDAARYADSDGYEKDKSRSMWNYRDWVVEAFNRDLPYDEFLVEQLAGDLLPDATQDQRVATGFLRNSMLNEEGGVDPEQFRMDAMFDRMDALGKCVLGLTIGCGQCHSHKYDPLTQEEYYRLFAFLNNSHEPQIVVYSRDEQAECRRLGEEISRLESELQSQNPDWLQKLEAWASVQQARQIAWQMFEPDQFEEVGGGAKLSRVGPGTMLCAGYAPTKCTFRASATLRGEPISGVRLEALTNPNLPCGGPGRSFKGTFALTEVRIEVAPLDAPDKPKAVAIRRAVADYSQSNIPLEPNFDDRSGKERIVGDVALAIDGKDETAWGVDAGNGRRNQDRQAVFELAEPIDASAGVILTVYLVQNHGGWNSDDHQNNLIGSFRLSTTSAAEPAAIAPLPRAVGEALNLPADERNAAQTAALFSHFRQSVSEWSATNAAIATQWQGWPAGSTALVLAERAEARETRILQRGDFLRPTAEVAAATPAWLNPFPEGAPANRLGMARWIADRQSPTTARVLVNRVWQSYFGTGLVSTPEDFGTQGERPSHPELLDWLAVDFMDHGWSLKHLHRRIARSATYRQSSRVSPESLAADPQNRRLGRGPRVRSSGEVVRDIALSASGLLTPTLGGPSVFPPLPESVLALSYGPMTWNAETGANRYRRALYTFRRRSIPFPALQNFDTPNGDSACVRRVRSNTPLQALTTLNEVVFVECAQALARKAWRDAADSDAARLEYAFRCCLSRAPTDEEKQVLLALLERQSARLAEGWADARVVAMGKPQWPGDAPSGATPRKLAALTLVSRVILNLDETITKE